MYIDEEEDLGEGTSTQQRRVLPTVRSSVSGDQQHCDESTLNSIDEVIDEVICSNQQRSLGLDWNFSRKRKSVQSCQSQTRFQFVEQKKKKEKKRKQVEEQTNDVIFRDADFEMHSLDVAINNVICSSKSNIDYSNFDETVDEVLSNKTIGINQFDTADFMSRQKKDRMRKKDAYAKKKSLRSNFFMKAFDSVFDTSITIFCLGSFNIKCKCCYAIHFAEEKPNACSIGDCGFFSCCKNGRLEHLASLLDDYPNELKHLFFQSNCFYQNFIQHIRRLNSSFAVASLSCFKFNFNTPGPPVFKISGQVYHKFNTVAQDTDGGIPTNGQLYFVDTEESISLRSSQHTECDPGLILYVEKIIRKHYPFAAAYMMMKELVEEYDKSESFKDFQVPEIKMLFSLRPGYDPNRFNLPRANEVCAIVVCNADDEIPPANIVVHQKGAKNLTNLNPLDENVELMIYPLFYPNKSKGWNHMLKDRDGKKISLCDFIKYRLFYREENDIGKFVPHFFAKKLFQQWCVDMATRVEWDRLTYIRLHQKIIQKCRYTVLEEFLSEKANKSGLELGKRVILPSTFSGGPRNMHEHFLDAMIQVKETGKPDLFITMTCNPSDPDILKCLNANETPNDRPEIVARVFKLKSDKLRDLIIKEGLFGDVVAFCWVIEFQKRGLPHMHMLITLQNEYKLRTPELLDRCITAEIPDEIQNKQLYDIVVKFMIHGPCGLTYPNAICWDKKKNKCSKKFPKAFREMTEINENGYPFYKRPNNGKCVYKKGVRLTNEYVVSYNPALLKMFNCHINVEKVADIKAVKYLYKYIYKGYDAATVECVTQTADGTQKILNYDEVSNFLEARCIGPVEACWRLFKFPLQGKSHSIDRLDVHLENEQPVFIEQQDDREHIIDKMQRDSKLLAYFNFMRLNPTLNILYPDMPRHCTWSKNSWKLRKAFQNKLGRMYTVNPKEHEKFYLRYLLLHVPARGYSDLKHVDDIDYETFSQACLARGLIRDDNEWFDCMEEASQSKFPRALRLLFANILIHCSPKFPHLLWDKFKDDLSFDLLKHYPDCDDAYMQALYLINKKLVDQDKSLNDFVGMPQLTGHEKRISEGDIVDPKNEANLADKLINLMNKDQFMIVNEFNDFFNEGKQKFLFVDGPGGTGKSFTLTALYHLFRSHNKCVCNMAFSGIAATVLKKGRTLHNRFKFPLDINRDSTAGIELGSKEAKEIMETDVFIWDEAPMCPRFCLDAINNKMKELLKTDKLFGGKTFILSGDFRQILPIKKNAARTEIVDLLIKNSRLWKYVKILHLTENMRADPEEKMFADNLLDIGNGSQNDENDFITVPNSCFCSGDLVFEIFGDIFKNRDYSQLKHRAILSSFNSDVDSYNTKCMKEFPGEHTVYNSIDESESSKAFEVTNEILHALKAASLPNHCLLLKRDCPVMLLRNLNVDEGLCNGTRLQVIDLGKYVLRCVIMCGDKTGEQCFIPRITIVEEKLFPFTLKRHQFPLKPAFAFTINKAQAQTFKKIGIDFTRFSFAHGQTYVALSRATSWSGVKIKVNKENENKKILNIVWKEVLSD